MDKALNAEVRDASQQVAARFAASIAGRAASPLAAAVAANVRARRDRVPVVAMGAGKLASGTPIRDVMFGAEFGGGARPTTRQFLPHQGTTGYFLYPAVRSQGAAVAQEWFDVIADTLATYWHN
jgi:hypothetical protein